MSYILDALQRADAERQRGAVPGLHDRPLPGQDSKAMADKSTRLWWLAAGALALSGIAAGQWVWRTPANEASLAQVAVPGAATPSSVIAPAPAPMPVAPAAWPPEAAPPAITPAIATKALGKPSAPVPIVVSAPVPQDPPAALATLPLLSELPETIRRLVPPLSITGTVYSENPTQRLLLVNNQVLPQGSQVAPEVTLEEIRQRSSVFSFHGTRFRVMH